MKKQIAEMSQLEREFIDAYFDCDECDTRSSLYKSKMARFTEVREKLEKARDTATQQQEVSV